jgi:DMSO/TMAO reductase YedYZ heme-binding membrane subunit
MNEQGWWYLSRATGMVAWVLLGASCLWGILLVTRMLKQSGARPAWLLDLHRWLGALAVITTLIHLLALVADNFVHFGWAELFVPWASPWKTTPVALGVLAFWLIVVVQGTSMVRRRLPRDLWKFLHYFAYIAVWLTSLHGALAGTDASNFVYRWIALTLTFVAVAAATIRVVVGTTRAQAAKRRARRDAAV